VVGPVWRRGPEHSDLLVPRTAAGQADPTASRKEQMRRERIMGANTRRGGTVEARQLPPRGRAHYLAIYGRQRPAETLVRTAVSARFMVRMGSRFDSGGGLNPKPAAQAGVTPGLMCAWRAPNRRLPEICQKARSVVVRTHGVTAELGELPRSPRPCGPRLTTGPGSPRRAEWPPPGWCGDSGHPWRCPDAGRHGCWAGPARGAAVDTASLASAGMGRHVWRLAARCGTGRLPSSDG
jgi:hypothetical protein